MSVPERSSGSGAKEEESEDESDIVEESPCGRWQKRREQVGIPTPDGSSPVPPCRGVTVVPENLNWPAGMMDEDQDRCSTLVPPRVDDRRCKHAIVFLS
ncbi:nuclear receptor-binding protein 2 isoform X1 [Arapaima gigas]